MSVEVKFTCDVCKSVFESTATPGSCEHYDDGFRAQPSDHADHGGVVVRRVGGGELLRLQTCSRKCTADGTIKANALVVDLIGREDPGSSYQEYSVSASFRPKLFPVKEKV